MRWTSTAPDLSSLSERVSEIVSTAIFSGTNCLVSSSPGIGTPLLTLDYGPRRPDAKRTAACPALCRIAKVFLGRFDVTAGVEQRQVVDDLQRPAQNQRQPGKGRAEQDAGQGRADRGSEAARHRGDARRRGALGRRHHG